MKRVFVICYTVDLPAFYTFLQFHFRENGEVGASEQYTPIDSTPESQNDQKQVRIFSFGTMPNYFSCCIMFRVIPILL